MLTLGPLAFAMPWALAALAILPLLWWLLRVLPPAPRRLRFPAIRLLFGLDGHEDAAAHTPWWILLLRLLLVTLVVLAAAHPVFNPARPTANHHVPLILVVEDGWAAARDWAARQTFLADRLAQAERAGQPVAVVTTAPPADGSPLQASPLLPAAQARPLVAALTPKPWPSDRAAAMAAVKAMAHDRVAEVIWLTDAIEDGHSQDFARTLQQLGGGVTLVTGRQPHLLLPPDNGGGERMNVPLRRPLPAGGPDRVTVRGLDGNGHVLARGEAVFAAGTAETTATLHLPVDLQNRLTRLDIEGEQGAAPLVLLDQRWRRRTVGLVGSTEGGAPLLGQLTYVERALSPTADLRHGEMGELLAGELAVLILADQPAPTGQTAERLERWIEQGGVLIRFAGPLLAQTSGGSEPDPLLPVRLRGGGRSLGGTMSWSEPQALAAFPTDGPFAGLPVPAEISVATQVLAEPTLDLAEHSWARLTDGTPLVTGTRRGKGWVVLVHTSANTSWSNLALSGLFVDMLKRLVDLSAGSTAVANAGGPLAPYRLLDGFGRLTPPNPGALPLTAGDGSAAPGPRHPPGLYGEGGLHAVNLSPALGHPALLVPPSGISTTTLGGDDGEIDLRGALLAASILLLLLDLGITLHLRGLLRAGSTAMAVALTFALSWPSPPVQAAETTALAAALTTRLAFVRTDAATDAKCAAGLKALSKRIGERSTASLGEPMGVDLEHDQVLFYPLLYWPVGTNQKPLSAAAADKLNAYMRTGGLVVMDTGAAGGGEADLRTATRALAIPPLVPVSDAHVLTRTFYLLKEMPGRLGDDTVWVADGQSGGNDGVSPVVIGNADWAAAWATDAQGNPLFGTMAGGDRQREMAYRFGVNLVMYALTGNYKADQVHLPTIMQRLGR